MTKRMHVIVISDDFAVFEHIHPVESADGHFRGLLALPRPGGYHVYADSVPAGIGHTVFRFDIPAGNAPASSLPRVVTNSAEVLAGPYRVTLDTLSLTVGKSAALTVHITRDGKPAADLHPYLGGSAHAVFINTTSLAYVHVHPMPLGGMSDSSTMPGMDMGGMNGADETHDLPDSARVDPAMMLHVAVPTPGMYRLWLQFRGGADLYVAPFALTAR